MTTTALDNGSWKLFWAPLGWENPTWRIWDSTFQDWLHGSHFPVCGNSGWLGVKAGCGFPLEEFPLGMWEVAPEAKQEEQMGQQKEKRERELVCDSFTHGTAENPGILGRG